MFLDTQALKVWVLNFGWVRIGPKNYPDVPDPFTSSHALMGFLRVAQVTGKDIPAQTCPKDVTGVLCLSQSSQSVRV